MINQEYKAMLSAKSVIRELSEYATARGKEIGYENVFDYSLGNPSVPCPDSYTKEVIRLHQEKSPSELHGYSPSLGNPWVRADIAESLNKRFSMDYETKHIFMTSAAASAIAHSLRAVTKPGDTILTFAPYFSEYNEYVRWTGCALKVVEADTVNFQINMAAFEEALTADVQAVLINTPNNPSGAVYSEDTLMKLADIMRAKEKEYGHDIFLVTDEPYREIVFDGKTAPYPSKYYDNSLSCYSYSKGLSLPGERIGYIAVNPRATDADILVVMFGQISRGIGHNCPSSTIQMAVAANLYTTSDVSIYETNMNLLYDKLVELGFTVTRPGGTFYIFPKALEDDAVAFCNKAKEYDLILVPSNGFGVKGFFRMAYCIDTDKVRRTLPVLEKFVNEQYPNR